MWEIENTIDQLFRYRKANEFSLDELENSYIYFPSNKELNDPFDTNHKMLRFTNDIKELDKLYHQMLKDSSLARICNPCLPKTPLARICNPCLPKNQNK